MSSRSYLVWNITGRDYLWWIPKTLRKKRPRSSFRYCPVIHVKELRETTKMLRIFGVSSGALRDCLSWPVHMSQVLTARCIAGMRMYTCKMRISPSVFTTVVRRRFFIARVTPIFSPFSVSCEKIETGLWYCASLRLPPCPYSYNILRNILIGGHLEDGTQTTGYLQT
jgi:hypothetical protein